MQFNATKADIGRIVYPVDNSWSQDLTTGKRPEIGENNTGLAGNYCTPAVLVKIVFGPFMLAVHEGFHKKDIIREFCIVRYEGKDYLVLNNFTTEQKELNEPSHIWADYDFPHLD